MKLWQAISNDFLNYWTVSITYILIFLGTKTVETKDMFVPCSTNTVVNKNLMIMWYVNTIVVHFWSQACMKKSLYEWVDARQAPKTLKGTLQLEEKCNSSVACLPVVDKGSALILHANHCTAHSHWRALWSTDPSQVIHQRRIVNWIPEKKKTSKNGKFLQTLPKSLWCFPVAESSSLQQLSLSRLIFTTTVGLGSVCLCVLCVLSRMLFRSSLWREHKMSSVNPHSVRNAMATPTERHMQGRQILSVCVCVCEQHCVCES